MFCFHQTVKEKEQAYILKHILKRENHNILLMITDGKKWHYLTVKNMAASLRWIKSKHDNDHYCINCLYLFRTEIAW